MASRAAVKWFWLDELGNRIPAATVEVFEPGTTTKIAQTIYVNDDPDASVYPNPFTSDANGIASFFLVNSRRVDLRFSKTGYATQTISSVDATKPSLGYNVLQDEGVALTSRDILNITGAGATVTDDAANGRTNVAFDGYQLLSGGSVVATDESTASTTYTDLTTVGPSVTKETGTSVIVIGSAEVYNNTADTYTEMAVAVSGATTLAANRLARGGMRHHSAVSKPQELAFIKVITGLTAGINTFKLQYMVSAGTGGYRARNLVVITL